MTIEMLINIITIVMILVGLVFFLGTAVGVLRFPDYYTRVHAAGKGDTLSSMVIILALAIYNMHDPSWADFLVSLKIGMIVLFIFITSPTTAHALMEAGYLHGVSPWTKHEKKESKEPREEQPASEAVSEKGAES